VRFAKMMKFIQYNLKNGDLVQGVLQVSKENPNEAYILESSPTPNNSKQLVVLGVRDRNRAQEGDIVVVKLKDRSQWIVREDMYEDWLNGALNVPCDEDGLPLTIPPIKVNTPENNESTLLKQAISILPPGLRHRVNKDKLKESVPISKSKRYNRESFLRMGVQLKLVLLEQQKEKDGEKPPSSADKPPIIPAQLEESVVSQLAELSVSKQSGSKSSDEHPDEPNNGPQSPSINKQSNGGGPRRRITHRFVSELDDEFSASIPSICLQKTARVLFVAEPKNNGKGVFS